MKTAVIWNEIEQLQYFVVEEDWSRFQGIYINTIGNEELQEELNPLIYGKDGTFLPKCIPLKEWAEEVRKGAIVVECGFLP